ncbi:GHKL domain-containing protein [bacterium]|nr:GHKL domain-containing protein [bacterium]
MPSIPSKLFSPTLLIYPVCLLLLAAQGLLGENLPDWRFFQVSQGAEESWINYVTIGSEGKIWISHGSTMSAGWMDGWPDENGKLVFRIPSPSMYSVIRQSKQGQLWSVSEDGAKLFQNGKWATFDIGRDYNPPAFQPNFLLSPTNMPFTPGDKNQVFYLMGNSLVLLDASTGQRMEMVHAAQTGIGDFIDLAGTREDYFWITGTRGIAQFHPKAAARGKAWQEFRTPGPEYAAFQSPVEGCEGELYVVASNLKKNKSDLLIFKNRQWQIKTGHSGSVRIGWPGLEDSYWVIGDKNGLFNISPEKGESEENASVLSGVIFCEVALEKNGVFWLATSRGLARYTPPLWRTPRGLKEELRWCHAIYEDSLGNIYLAAGGRILVYNGRHWQRYDLAGQKDIYDRMSVNFLSLSDNRTAVFYPKSGCYSISPAGLKKIPYQDASGKFNNRTVLLMSSGRKHKVWLSTYAGMDSVAFRVENWDGEVYKPVINMTDDYDIESFYEAANGNLWIGSAENKHCLALFRNGALKMIGPDDGYTGGGVFCFHEFEDGRIWIGCRNQIFEYDGGKWSLIRDWGLDNVYSIHGHSGGSVWVASTTGIHRYYKGLWVTYTAEDGLPNTAATFVFEDSRGTVWAGTTQGVSCFHPEADSDPPRTLISKRDNPSEVPPSGEARLVFTAVDKWNFTKPEKLFFSYRLDGGQWSAFQTSNVTWLSHLAYGPHRFEVRSMDLNLNIDAKPALFDFTVLLPWYRERGFLIVAAIGSLTILFLLGVVIRRHLLLEKLVLERTNELQSANATLTRNKCELENLLQSEQLLAKIASLLNSSDSFFDSVGELLEKIGLSAGLDLACLVIDGKAGKRAETVGCWVSPSYAESGNPGRVADNDGVSALYEKPAPGSGRFVSDLSGVTAEERRFAEELAISSFAVIPLEVSSKATAFMYLAKMEAHPWNDQEIELLNTIADVMANSLQRQTHFQARLDAEKKGLEAVQMAEKASRMASIGVMAGGITHEINQPLNALKLNSTQVLSWTERARGIIPDKVVEKLRRVPEYINRIEEIVKHMSEFWISPNQKVNERFDLKDSVQHALTLINRQINIHRIKFNLNVEPVDMPIQGNHINVELILINLVVNAVQALDELQKQDKTITISIRRNGSSAVLEVSDNGKALFRGNEERIFDPFYSTKKPSLGIGLGLAIVKRLTQELSGKVNAFVNNEDGATFIVEIPLTGSHEEEI